MPSARAGRGPGIRLFAKLLVLGHPARLAENERDERCETDEQVVRGIVTRQLFHVVLMMADSTNNQHRAILP
jgi:hypothetical protein